MFSFDNFCMSSYCQFRSWRKRAQLRLLGVGGEGLGGWAVGVTFHNPSSGCFVTPSWDKECHLWNECKAGGWQLHPSYRYSISYLKIEFFAELLPTSRGIGFSEWPILSLPSTATYSVHLQIAARMSALKPKMALIPRKKSQTVDFMWTSLRSVSSQNSTLLWNLWDLLSN